MATRYAAAARSRDEVVAARRSALSAVESDLVRVAATGAPQSPDPGNDRGPTAPERKD
jgi:hypothetical protein